MKMFIGLYRRDRSGFVRDFFVAAFLVFAIAIGSLVSLVIADWAING